MRKHPDSYPKCEARTHRHNNAKYADDIEACISHLLWCHTDYDEEDVMANCKDSFDYTENYWKDNFEDEDEVEIFLTKDWDD